MCCVHVCVCVHICMCGGTHVCVHVCVHVCEGSRLMLEMIFRCSSTSFPETGLLRHTQRLQTPACSGGPGLYLLKLGLQVGPHSYLAFTRFWGPELWFSDLHSQYFNPFASNECPYKETLESMSCPLQERGDEDGYGSTRRRM